MKNDHYFARGAQVFYHDPVELTEELFVTVYPTMSAMTPEAQATHLAQLLNRLGTVVESQPASLLVERDIEKNPYSPDENRVAKFFFDLGVGGGPDPIGALLASHVALAAERNAARRVLRALYDWFDRDGSPGGASEVFEANRWVPR